MRIRAVTPHAGVWIETATWLAIAPIGSESHPTRVCGLKPAETAQVIGAAQVTPHAGVWIETNEEAVLVRIAGSHPTRVCGLKHNNHSLLYYTSYSHTPRGCVD